MTVIRMTLGVASAVVLVGLTATPAHADDPAVPMHHVKYTLTAQKPIYAQIYYLDQEPEIFANWSHNPYQYMPNVQTDLGPNQAWTFELDLQKPDEWAMVMANTGPEPGEPSFHCEIAVDGNTVVSNDGAKAVLCSIRKW